MTQATVVEFVGSSGKFAKMPTKVFDKDLELKTTDIAVLACLCSFADNETNIAFPRVKKIAETLNSSPRTIHRSLRKLEEAHVISKVRRTNNEGGNISSLYQICLV